MPTSDERLPGTVVADRADPTVRNNAFTLPELLLVIVTSAVLVGLSLPILTKAQGKAKGIGCKNNLRQLLYAWLTYADDHGDLICPNQSTLAGPATDLRNWTNPLDWSASPGSWVVGNPQLDSSSSNIEKGALSPYTQSLAVYHCPADHSCTRTPAKVPRNRSYALNIYLNGTTPLWGTAWIKIPQVTTPGLSGIWGFLDVSEPMINGCDFAVYPDDNWYDIPADRHNKGLNLSYLDGHVDYHSWRSSKVEKSIGSAVQSQSDLEDLRWLQKGLPIP
jgi:prepilin-type processing-associated H-X9-DG protein